MDPPSQKQQNGGLALDVSIALFSMDDSSYRLNFDLGKKNKIYEQNPSQQLERAS
jgi:hypothetical protein